VASGIRVTHTEFTLVRSEQIKDAQDAFETLEGVGNWLPVATLLLAGGGVLLAARRRRALVAAPLAVAAGVVALGVALAVFKAAYVDQLSAGTDARAAGTIYDQLVGFLGVAVRMTIAMGVVVAFGAWLSGPGRWAARVRRMWEPGIAAVREAAGVVSTGAAGRWVGRCKQVLRWGAVLVGVVVLLLWSIPTGMVIFWIALVTLAAMAVVEFLDDRHHGGARVGAQGAD